MKRSLIHCALLAGLFAGTAQAQVQMGNGAVANKPDTTAVGDRAQSLTIGATTIGADALADGGTMVDENGVPGECVGATALGNRATARGCHTTALGFLSEAQGSNALAIGSRAKAFAVYAVAVGPQAQATGDFAVAIGGHSLASGISSVAIGSNARSPGASGTAVGPTARADENGGAAFGSGATAQGVNNLALGAASQTEGEGASAVGPGANATADFAGSYGYGAGAAGEAGTAVGPWAQAFAPYSAALGALATANATESVVLGPRAVANARGCVAVGANTTCDEEETAAFGNRRLTQVALGRADNDAVAVSQLRTAVETLGAGATVVNGVIVAPNYQLSSGNNYTTVAGAIYDLDGRVHQLEQNPGGGGGATGPQGPQGPTGPQGPAGQDGKDGGSSTTVAGANIEVTDNGNGTQTVGLKDTVELSEQGSVQVAKAIHNSDGFTVQGGPSVTRSGINAGNQRVTGVAAGAIAPGSTDAINGGQLWDYQREQDDRWNQTDRRFRQLDKRVSGVCAMAQANAQMATSTSAIHGENRNRLAVGVGGCSGQAAISIGYTRDVTTPRGSPSAFSIGVSRSGQDTAVGAAWAIGW
ncbi:adhesin [Stenotrophomonas maltophilia]|uniref:adhesin n=1 Tax=Stenotrophomonas maltophilia TaxID=40324 RepID=UPI001312274F|nr:adhesin [Stenotrophomonas maltophilia]